MTINLFRSKTLNKAVKFLFLSKKLLNIKVYDLKLIFLI